MKESVRELTFNAGVANALTHMTHVKARDHMYSTVPEASTQSRLNFH
jgi:hypothetical protein